RCTSTKWRPRNDRVCFPTVVDYDDSEEVPMSTIAPPKLVLGPGMAGIFLTPQEFDAVEEADRDYRYELINGRLIVSPAPLEAERGPNEEFGHMLLTYRDTQPQGSALDATLPEHTVITKNNRRRADRVIWVGLGRQPDPE